jgi:mycothiol synthase
MTEFLPSDNAPDDVVAHAAAAASTTAPEWLTALIARAREADGQPPFSDQSLIDLRTGARELVAIDENAAALLSPGEAEFVVDPAARGRGLGTALLEGLLKGSPGELLIWAHGDHPAARALAKSHSLEAVRELLHLRLDLGSHNREAQNVDDREAQNVDAQKVDVDAASSSGSR